MQIKAKRTPADVLAVVRVEHDAYNAQDIERPCSYHASNAVIVDGDGKLFGEGSDGASRGPYGS